MKKQCKSAHDFFLGSKPYGCSNLERTIFALFGTVCTQCALCYYNALINS